MGYKSMRIFSQQLPVVNQKVGWLDPRFMVWNQVRESGAGHVIPGHVIPLAIVQVMVSLRIKYPSVT